MGSKYSTLGFIGFGKMANAICGGVISSGFISPENIFAYDTNKAAFENSPLSEKINCTSDIKVLLNSCSNILLATKPFVVDEVISNIKDFTQDKLVISIIAGIPISKFENNLNNARVVRVMPNTPAMVNEGMSVVAGGKKSVGEDVNFVKELFSHLGRAIILDEEKINAVTAVSGSGPAFYYYIIDKIAKAGVSLGLDYDTALVLSSQTALGAAKMILETKMPPSDLIKAVTTPNGTTAEGNKVLENSSIEKILFETIEKTNKRAIELGK